MKDIDFIFDCLIYNSLYYKCHEIDHNLGRLYIDYGDWIKYKKATITTINKNKYAASTCCNNTVNFLTNWKKSLLSVNIAG